MDSQRISYAQARRIYPLKKPINFWNRFTFLNKHLILFRSLKEPFSGILMNISNCRAFSPFETMPSSVIRGVKLPSCRQPSDKKTKQNKKQQQQQQQPRTCPLKNQINF